MLEGREESAGWFLVVLAVVALVVFTALLYVRAGAGSHTVLTGAEGSIATRPPSTTARPSSPRPTASVSPRPSASAAVATDASTGASDSLSDSPEPSASDAAGPGRTLPPSATSSLSGNATPSEFFLGESPRTATARFINGHGDCAGVQTEFQAEVTFAVPTAGRLDLTGPTGSDMSGRITASGSFDVSSSSERWKGEMTDTGGDGNYFLTTNGCVEGYEATFVFQ